jgi:hypothetical protein
MSRKGTRLLFCAFAEVPGGSAVGVRLAQVLAGLPEGLDVDALCLKGEEQAHIQRLGVARMMRVPSPSPAPEERLGAFRRALTRQLDAECYDLVWCADLASALVAAAFKEAQRFVLVVEPTGILPGKGHLRSAQLEALKAATRVLVPSRCAARLLAGVDARRLRLLPRAVDRALFTPPTVEPALAGRQRVLVVAGRDQLATGVGLLSALQEASVGATLALALAPGQAEEDARLALEGAGVRGVELVLPAEPAELASALRAADVVVVPSVAEAGREPLGVPHRALESMACRRATVLTGPEAAFADALVPQQDALVVPARAAVAVAQAVAKLLGAPALRESVAQAGARRVEQEADLATRQRELLALLGEELGVDLKGVARAGHEASDPSVAGVGAPAEPSLPAAPAAFTTESGPIAGRASSVFTSKAPSELAAAAAPADTMVGVSPMSFASLAPSAGGEEWAHDTHIEQAHGAPTPRAIDPSADTVRPASSTASSSSPHQRTFIVEATFQGTSEPDGDPWTYDTIADARPVFSTDDVPRPAPSGSGASFLVDRERFSAPLDDELPGVEVPSDDALEEMTLDEGALREGGSSEG